MKGTQGGGLAPRRQRTAPRGACRGGPLSVPQETVVWGLLPSGTSSCPQLPESDSKDAFWMLNSVGLISSYVDRVFLY